MRLFCETSYYLLIPLNRNNIISEKKAYGNIILRKKADGAAAYYRPMYKNADENSLFLEVYTYVHCGDAAKAEIIATSIEATLDDWLKT